MKATKSVVGKRVKIIFAAKRVAFGLPDPLKVTLKLVIFVFFQKLWYVKP